MARVLVGLVGYCQFVRGYVLGPELMERLQHAPGADPADVREMNWGPIAIVQDLQASGEKFDRVVLVGARDRGLTAGSVVCRRWTGQPRDVMAVQRRVFEAVTGVVSVDNLIVIGAHFGVWPDEVLSVEVQMAESSLGDLVLAEVDANRQTGQVAVVGEHALSPVDLAVVEHIVRLVGQAVREGAVAASESVALDSDAMEPGARIFHYDFQNAQR